MIEARADTIPRLSLPDAREGWGEVQASASPQGGRCGSPPAASRRDFSRWHLLKKEGKPMHLVGAGSVPRFDEDEPVIAAVRHWMDHAGHPHAYIAPAEVVDQHPDLPIWKVVVKDLLPVDFDPDHNDDVEFVVMRTSDGRYPVDLR